MKKLLLFALLSLLALSNVKAQQLSYGFKLGANLTTMNTDGDETKTGFNGGVFGQLRIANFAIQPEVLFSMQGAKYDYITLWDDIMIQYTGKVNISYLSVPVMLQYYIIPGLAVEGGPQVSFLLAAKNKPDDWESRKIKNLMKSTDFALNFGASYKLPAVPLGFYARYSLGLSDIFEKENYEVFEQEKGKNRMVQLGMFVKF